MKAIFSIAFIIICIVLAGLLYIYFSKQNQEIASSTNSSPVTPNTTTKVPSDPKKEYPKAIELRGLHGYVNTNGKEITLQELIGIKVILINFWTYSCINCKRTLGYFNEWYEEFGGDNFEIIGIHTPEFSFEHKYENVQRAVQEEGINYPVVLDNDYKTWRAYSNRYWPRRYVIDINGNIIYDHIGEGAYEETRNRIISAIKERQTLQNTTQ